VEVYEDTNRVVVTGCADVEEVVEKPTRRLRIPYRDLTIMSCQHPQIELSSDDDEEVEEEEEEEDDDDDDDDDEEEGHGTCFPAARIDEPWWEDQPVPDPSSWFVINLSAPPQDDGDDED